MKIINLTPHIVSIVSPACAEFDPRTKSYKLVGELKILKTYEPEGSAIPRCSMREEEIGVIDNVPVVKNTYGEVTDLPPEEEDTYYIVSALVANAAKRSDLLIPSRMVRDTEGKILGCLAFGKV